MTPSPRAAVNDESLMQRYRDGDGAALRELFVRHAAKLQAFSLCLLPGPEPAEELCEKTWQRLHRSRREYTSGTPFLPWFYGFAVQLRRDSVRSPVVSASQPGAARAVTDPASLLRALSDLPDSYREVLVLHRLVELPFPAIAQALGATESAVQQRAQQGYEQLAEMTAIEPAAPIEDRGRAGHAVFDPTILSGAIDPAPLEQCAHALLPMVAHDLAPRRPPWPLFAAFVLLLSVVALCWMRLFH